MCWGQPPPRPHCHHPSQSIQLSLWSLPHLLSSSVSTSLGFILSPQVFQKGVSGPVFFVASRGHHADIGGITPGSMPPNSTSLQQEGAVFISFKLVTGGVFQEKGKRVQRLYRDSDVLKTCNEEKLLHWTEWMWKQIWKPLSPHISAVFDLSGQEQGSGVTAMHYVLCNKVHEVLVDTLMHATHFDLKVPTFLYTKW